MARTARSRVTRVPVLLRGPVAAAVAVAALALAVAVARGDLSLLFPALCGWGLCVVAGIRALVARRAAAAALYALGALPATFALLLVALG